MRDKKFLQERMEKLWHPRRVAMAGATNSMMKWGFIILARMLNEGFPGKVFPVNPKDPKVLGLPAFRSVREVPGEVDVALVVTPAPAVPSVIKDCAAKKVAAAIVITSGFSETGEQGRAMEEEIVRIARDAGMILVGPNTMGIYSAAAKFNCLMAPVSPLPGRAACISQSGNVGTHMLFRGKTRGLGFGKFVSSGNEGDLHFEDYLWFFGEDPETNMVLGYLEGLDPGNRFMEVAAEVTKKKPVILLKGGRTRAGSRAASSHTGSLAGDAAVVEGAMRQAGVILADSNREVVELARALELQPPPRGNRVGILTRGGGWGVVTSDACEENGLQVPDLHPRSIEKLDRILPPYWSRGNPVDMVAMISYQAYLDCLEIIVNDENVDAVIALGANIEQQSITTLAALKKLGLMEERKLEEFNRKSQEEASRFLQDLAHFIKQSPKPVLTVGRWREISETEAGLMMIAEPEDAARMMAKMAAYGKYLKSRGLL